jgi:steroid delta-isomerase-like uncharacterized protein
MAADRKNRGGSQGERQKASSQSAGPAGSKQETGRAAGGPRTSEREQRIETVRETGEARERGASAENARIARMTLDSWNERDFDQATRLAAESVECLHVPFDITYRGRDGYREFMQSWATAFPDGRVEIRRVIAGEDGAAIEYIGRGTHTGPLAGPGGTIPATGRRGELALCDVIEIEQGQIRRVRSYFDSATLMRQLGIRADSGASE